MGRKGQRGYGMKKKEVEIGKNYLAKISGKLTAVKIVSESPYGGWIGRNIATGREVRIKTAAKLRWEWERTKEGRA